MKKAIQNIGATNQAYYQWCKKHIGLKLNQAKLMKNGERECSSYEACSRFKSE